MGWVVSYLFPSLLKGKHSEIFLTHHFGGNL